MYRRVVPVAQLEDMGPAVSAREPTAVLPNPNSRASDQRTVFWPKTERE